MSFLVLFESRFVKDNIRAVYTSRPPDMITEYLYFRYTHGPCAQGYSFIPIIFGIMLYSVYIMECWHTRAKFSKIKKVRGNNSVCIWIHFFYLNALNLSI
jgi:hypothetical protein